MAREIGPTVAGPIKLKRERLVVEVRVALHREVVRRLVVGVDAGVPRLVEDAGERGEGAAANRVATAVVTVIFVNIDDVVQAEVDVDRPQILVGLDLGDVHRLGRGSLRIEGKADIADRRRHLVSDVGRALQAEIGRIGQSRRAERKASEGGDSEKHFLVHDKLLCVGAGAVSG